MRALPTYDDVVSAAGQIEGHALRTPVLTSAALDAETGAQFFFKAENLQRIGAFKFRGAFNALTRFSDEQKKRGVIAFSSGNHAQAVALSAKLLGISATILMPEDAPQSKLEATRGYGANVITFNRYKDDRDALTNRLAEEGGLTLIPPYNHPHIIAGQGTATKELIEEVGPLDALFVCVGGGGLIAGSALAAKALSPDCAVYGVEPEAGNDVQQSLRAGKIVRIDTPQTLADGAQTQAPGDLTFAIIREKVTDVLAVSDQALVDGMKFFARQMKLVVEPTGCLAFAGARQMADQLRGKRVGVIVSGGNVDLSRYTALLNTAV
ncbi:threo-3-hydroxy-L-aspartate ammonia-lyase [Ochrobactrum soli]|uniref:Threo-3-hydroxy-L-aspartate ammonia-lyase n=2 Tax=Ochrobactrum TaxID=528 RepID=A0A2P9HP88_9HYPH|nr:MULTISPECIES: threo-3-hydroxy-L-aspartate ammonia-lyase [Brucella]MCI1001648.1 threo-3-hydroxy-L-aspartate ammonia-lyase [Ochrobactrum sp. C6C9]RRD22125.1 threo-3-hydroxy-L-aspartate ammonia-lyase [Brucellaceae bacterium VT-16-1752]WHT42236.1 threo-3-hydroxy-L-aspartate ammonia-lyase [Ochrobactrum sp. SSR]NNU61310.1 threo-3-hydroxy-L-aspartate ammonia-lyase [[Ochrobactrum] soli]RLL75768.1 threo-3-hydroxy-L-aspartate ammonia-lyase [[Ochrobactrum] soli]